MTKNTWCDRQMTVIIPTVKATRPFPWAFKPAGLEVIHNPGKMSPVTGLSVLWSKLKNAHSYFYDRSQQNLKDFEYINTSQNLWLTIE